MIHNGSLKAQSSHVIDVTKIEGKDGNASLPHLTIPSVLKNMEAYENGLFTKSPATHQTWLERSSLRCEMYFTRRQFFFSVEEQNFVLEELIVSKISLCEMERFLKEMIFDSIQTCCERNFRKM
jgi:hypothetical protein